MGWYTSLIVLVVAVAAAAVLTPDAMVPTIRPRCQAQRCSAVSVALMRSSSNLLPSGPFTHFQLPYGRGAKPNVPFLSPTVFAALRFVHVLCCPVALTLFSSTLCPSSPLPHAAAIPRQAQRPLPLAHGVRSAALRPPAIPRQTQRPLPLADSVGSAALRPRAVLLRGSGASVWVTFFAGVIMFRHLPRHTFGSIQGRLFPAYFRLMALSSALSALALKLTLKPRRCCCRCHALIASFPTQIMQGRHGIEEQGGIKDEAGDFWDVSKVLL
ncbi:unnamed protein product, partial [Closterium sp. NIES-65]